MCLHKLFVILHWRFVFSPPCINLFISLLIFISLWTHEYLFYTLSYSPMLPNFVVQIVLPLATKLFYLASGFLLTCYIKSVCVCVYVSCTCLLSGHTKWSKLILYVSCHRPRISHLSKKPWFILLKIGFRNHDLGSRYALFHWDIVSFRSSH